MSNTMSPYTGEDTALPMACENIESVTIVQGVSNPRMDLNRGITEEELMTRINTRLKSMFI